MLFRLHSGRLLSYSKKQKRKLAKVTTRFYSLSFVVTRCQSLLLVLPRCQSLSLNVLLVCLIINDRKCTATSKQVIIRHMTICQLLNDTHREKLFYSIQYKNGCLTASNLLICLYNQLSSIHSIITFEKCDSSNRQ